MNERPAHTDLLILGGGSAGYAAARTATAAGKSVAIVDGAKELGGLCILAGCMPSKTLLWSAEALHLARRGREFGLEIPEARADMAALQARKRRIIREFADYRQAGLTSGRHTLHREQGRFLDAHTVELAGGARLTADRFLIATGSRIAARDLPGLDRTPFLTSDDILNLETAPESVLVLGGGVVACELAQFLRRVGSRVTQLARGPRLLPKLSPEASAAIEESFLEEGVELLTGASTLGVSGDDASVEVRFLRNGREHSRRAAKLFVALGREPRTEGLGLAEAGVRTDSLGRVAADAFQRTTAAHIYAAGDVCGPREVVHLAVAQGELAARHAFGLPGAHPVDPALALEVVFTDPPAATLGLTEPEARKRFGDSGVLTASYPFNDHGKSILMGVTRGHVKIIAGKDRRELLGAEIVGPCAGELIHCLTTPLAMGATVHDLLRAPWYHPTLAEILTYPLEEIAEA